MEPAIFSLIGCPVIGEVGDKTEVVRPPACPVCNRRPPPVFTFIEYRFDRWAGEDLVTAMGEYAVSERLRRAMESAGLTGATFRDMAVSKGDYFVIEPPAYADDLPPFYQLVVTGRASGPEVWWTSETCPACGVTFWSPTDEGVRAHAADLTGDMPTPRQVYRDSWKGDDIFSLGDPGFPVVTQRFVDVLNRVGVIGVKLQPAEWADRP